MTNTNHKLLLLLCGHFLLSRVFGELLEPDYVMQRFKCDLQCHNNGVCSHLTTNEDQLRKRMQSGQMIQQCDCPRGYRGMSCDVSVDEFPCPKENAGRLRSDCDCAVADQVSAFAGEQCRNPSTEYCASLSKSIGGHIFFCSHGGKCNGDIIAAQLNPGNTSSNYLYQHTGCTCPPEFTGPHCEFLNLELAVANNTEDEDDNRSLVAFYVVFILGLATLGLLVIRKVRTRYQRAHIRNSLSIPPDGINLNSYADEDEGIFSDPHEEEDHDSSSSSDEYQDALPPIA